LDKIRSAFEMAMERYKDRKEVPQSEIDKMEYEPVGRALAAKYLNENNYDILSEIKKYPGQMAAYILNGSQETFLINIQLPVDKSANETNIKAMNGLKVIKIDQQSLKEIYEQLEHLFQYYDRTIEQAYSQFKDNYATKIKSTMKSLEKRAGGKVKIDPEKYPGFREEWMRAISVYNTQYEQILGEHKDKLRKIK